MFEMIVKLCYGTELVRYKQKDTDQSDTSQIHFR